MYTAALAWGADGVSEHRRMGRPFPKREFGEWVWRLPVVLAENHEGSGSGTKSKKGGEGKYFVRHDALAKVRTWLEGEVGRVREEEEQRQQKEEEQREEELRRRREKEEAERREQQEEEEEQQRRQEDERARSLVRRRSFSEEEDENPKRPRLSTSPAPGKVTVAMLRALTKDVRARVHAPS